jgi:transposase
MAPRYTDNNQGQGVFISVNLDQQLQPGTFEHTLNFLIDNRLDLSIFHHKYRNENTGRPAYDPALLLKIVLMAYSRGVTGSRRIEALCRENVLFMALAADTRPHFTTVADFISGSREEIAQLFHQVLMICDRAGLIGKQMFAIDGCKLPSNASKDWSGTHENLRKKSKKIDKAVRHMLAKHREEDQKGENDDTIRRREEQQIETLLKTSDKIDRFLEKNAKRIGRRGKEVQSNITDNDSAKMKTSHGVIQGYTGVAAVDAKHQVVVHAEAFGTGDEHGLLEPMLDGIKENLDDNIMERSQVLADSGFHSATTLSRLEEEGIDAYIADTRFRSRDPRFADAGRHKPQAPKKPQINGRYTPEDFQADIENRTCICPAGKAMWLKSDRAKITGRIFMQFQAHQADCASCRLRAQCLRSPKQKYARQVNILLERLPQTNNNPLVRMREKIDSTLGRHIYSRRLGIVEPVFGHLRENIGLRRFSLRGREKVDGQWKLMAMLHNLTKIHRYGLAI